jgi:hypothetical protein
MAGALAQYGPGGATVAFVVLLAALVAAVAVVARSHESREAVRPRPRYRSSAPASRCST